jgi:hypothetical protein
MVVVEGEEPEFQAAELLDPVAWAVEVQEAQADQRPQVVLIIAVVVVAVVVIPTVELSRDLVAMVVLE